MASCTYSVPDKNSTGDNFYGQFICKQVYVDYFWNTYGFNGNKNYWDDGFGWDDCCNTNQPLARTFNACYLLTYSADDYLNDNYDAPQNILQWGRRFVREKIDDLRSMCGDGSAIAATFGSDRTELYLGFFYTKDVPGRAETLCHEARHYDKPHRKKRRRFQLGLSGSMDIRSGIPMVVLCGGRPHYFCTERTGKATRQSCHRQRICHPSRVQHLAFTILAQH